MPRYSSNVRDYVLDSVDLIDLVGSKVSLQRAGSIMKGLCPFHSEKTPSFVVSNERKNYHCFGCNAHGNAIDFVMETENMTFIEALESLADRFHLDLDPYIEERLEYKRDIYDKIYAMNLEAAKFFRSNLFSSPEAMDYFLGRGLGEKTVKRFVLGYAPDSWDSLVKHLASKGYSQFEIRNSGLASVSSNGNLIDKFRNRLIFPIMDHRDRILGFGGRSLGEDMPKYLNSPEGPVFKKSEILYGDRMSRKAKKQDGVVLVEGYMDMIQVYQSGFPHVLASMGTALTESQAKKIFQRYKIVFFAYDMDKAGRKAIDRSIPVLENAGIEVRVMKLDGAKDPDEFIKRFGAKVFRSKIESAINVIKYRLDGLREKHDISDAQGRLDYINESMELISEISKPVEAEVYIQELSDISGIAFETLSTEYSRRLMKSKDSQAGLSGKDFTSFRDSEKADLNGMDPLSAIEVELLRIAISDRELALLIDAEIDSFLDDNIGESFAALMVYYVSEEKYDPVLLAEIVGYDAPFLIEKYYADTAKKKSKETLDLLLRRRKILIVSRQLKEIDEKISKLIYENSDESKIELRKLRQKRNNLMRDSYRKNFDGSN